MEAKFWLVWLTKNGMILLVEACKLRLVAMLSMPNFSAIIGWGGGETRTEKIRIFDKNPKNCSKFDKIMLIY